MREYAQSGAKEPDVALQLPTGSGKTLVGLMIGEWLRRKNGERIVYLCPTRQLVNQVVDQATGSYGLTLNGFTGSRRDYDPKVRASYLNADTIAPFVSIPSAYNLILSTSSCVSRSLVRS
jgi:replicative superfamily II helicase